MNYITALDWRFYSESWPRYREQLGSHIIREYPLRYATRILWTPEGNTQTSQPEIWAVIMDDWAKTWLNLQYPDWTISEHTD